MLTDESCGFPNNTADSSTPWEFFAREVKSSILNSVRMNRRTFARHFAPFKKETHERLTSLEGEMKVVQDDVGSLKQQAETVEGTMTKLEGAVGTLQGDVDGLKDGMGKLEDFVEKLGGKLEGKLKGNLQVELENMKHFVTQVQKHT